MTCSFAMRGSRKSLFDAGLNRSTRLESSQLTDVGGAAALPPTPPPVAREARNLRFAPAKPALGPAPALAARLSPPGGPPRAPPRAPACLRSGPRHGARGGAA